MYLVTLDRFRNHKGDTFPQFTSDWKMKSTWGISTYRRKYEFICIFVAQSSFDMYFRYVIGVLDTWYQWTKYVTLCKSVIQLHTYMMTNYFLHKCGVWQSTTNDMIKSIGAPQFVLRWELIDHCSILGFGSILGLQICR